MKSPSPLLAPVLALTVLPLRAHHGQDFLVTLDTATPQPGQLFSTSGFDYSKRGAGEEFSFLQAFNLGLPGNLTIGATYRLGRDGSAGWSEQSITPTLQWNAFSWQGENHRSLNFGIALGWEIPTAGGHGTHSHGDNLSLTDCSPLIRIPALYQACLASNASRQNHTHDEGHAHNGVHRHGQSHGFLRLIADAELGHHDKVTANFIAVFPEDEDPVFGYALAYRHRFNELFATGIEATGDFTNNGEHSLFLTTTFYPNEALSLTLGAATGLTAQSPDISVQSLLTWRF